MLGFKMCEVYVDKAFVKYCNFYQVSNYHFYLYIYLLSLSDSKVINLT